MSTLAVLDPGLWRCGVAVFVNRILTFADEPTVERGLDLAPAIHASVRAGIGSEPDEWVAEQMWDYEGMSSRDATLTSIRAVVDRVCPVRTLYLPRVWKGQVPKPIHHRRILRTLSERERYVVELLPRTRDAMDAIGIGLFHLGRTARGGILPDGHHRSRR